MEAFVQTVTASAGPFSSKTRLDRARVIAALRRREARREPRRAAGSRGARTLWQAQLGGVWETRSPHTRYVPEAVGSVGSADTLAQASECAAQAVDAGAVQDEAAPRESVPHGPKLIQLWSALAVEADSTPPAGPDSGTGEAGEREHKTELSRMALGLTSLLVALTSVKN